MLIYCLHINSIPILFCKACIMQSNTPLPPGRKRSDAVRWACCLKALCIHTLTGLATFYHVVLLDQRIEGAQNRDKVVTADTSLDAISFSDLAPFHRVVAAGTQLVSQWTGRNRGVPVDSDPSERSVVKESAEQHAIAANMFRGSAGIVQARRGSSKDRVRANIRGRVNFKQHPRATYWTKKSGSSGCRYKFSGHHCRNGGHVTQPSSKNGHQSLQITALTILLLQSSEVPSLICQRAAYEEGYSYEDMSQPWSNHRSRGPPVKDLGPMLCILQHRSLTARSPGSFVIGSQARRDFGASGTRAAPIVPPTAT